MTTTPAPSSDPAVGTIRRALEPVRDALLRDASVEADRIVSAASDAAREVVASATAEADAEVDRVRHSAKLAAQAHTELTLAQLRNDAHRVVLQAQEQLRHQLIDSVHASARLVRHDPRYPKLLDHLEAMARRQLGTDALIERDPETDGGVLAEAGSRRADYRLTPLADRALDALADEVAELWN